MRPRVILLLVCGIAALVSAAGIARGFGRALTAMAVPLVAYAALGIAVLGLPRRPNRVLLLAGAVAAAVVLGWVAVQLATADPGTGYLRRPTTAEALAMIGAPLLVALLVIAAGTVATQRVQTWLVAGGFAVTGLSLLSTLDLSRYSLVSFAGNVAQPELAVETGLRWLSGASLASYSAYGSVDVLPPLFAVAQVAGALLVAAGCVRAGSTPAEAGDPGGDAGT